MGEARVPNNLTNTRLDASRAAVQPMSQGALLLDYYRKLLTPNFDANRTSYRGIVMRVLEADDKEFFVDDIFYDQLANENRISGNKNTNTKRKLLFVHVPNFITNNRINPSFFLHYDTFNKIRVPYEGKEKIQIGSIVEIQFRDKDKHASSFVSNVIDFDITYKRVISEIISSLYKENAQDIYLNIKKPDINEKPKARERYRSAGGYARAIYELNVLNTAEFKDVFLETLNEKIFGAKDKIKINITEITVDTKIKNYLDSIETLSPDVASTNTSQNAAILFSQIIKENNYLLYCKLEIDCEKKEQLADLRDLYFSFIKGIFFSKLYFTIEKNSLITKQQNNELGFSVDININELTNKSSKNIDLYIETSKIWEDNIEFGKVYNYYLTPPPNSMPDIITGIAV